MGGSAGTVASFALLWLGLLTAPDIVMSAKCAQYGAAPCTFGNCSFFQNISAVKTTLDRNGSCASTHSDLEDLWLNANGPTDRAWAIQKLLPGVFRDMNGVRHVLFRMPRAFGLAALAMREEGGREGPA